MPDQTLTATLKLRLTQEQLDEVKALAAADHRSVGAVVRRAIRELLEREAQEEAA